MQRNVSKAWILLGLLTVLGCQRDLEYDIPGATPQLVINSLFTLDSVFRVEVSMSATPGQGNNLRSLRDAKVTMYEDQTAVTDWMLDSVYATPFDFSSSQTASLVPIKLFYRRTETTKVQSGHAYRIEVKYPDLATVEATNTVPRPVGVTSVVQNFDASLNVAGVPMTRRTFQIDDRSTRESYYAIQVLASLDGSGAQPEQIPFFSGEKSFSENLTDQRQFSDGVLYEPSTGVYFSNGKFKGRKMPFDIYVEEKYVGSQYLIKLRILTLSKDFFEFATSYQKQKNNSTNPFAEPTQVYSNVLNGLGIFAGYSVTEITL